MFKKFFSKKNVSSKPVSYAEGKELFDLGVEAANKGNFKLALEYYSKSIEVCDNPAAYLNRARILFKKIRYNEGLNDLQKAKHFDSVQANEFSDQIAREINAAQFYTENYRNGVRDRLLTDYEAQNDIRFIGRRIFCVSFKVQHTGSEHSTYNSPLVEYHFFNELDNVRMFENIKNYPEVEEFLQAYPNDFIQKKLEAPTDHEAYEQAEKILHSFLCSYEEKEMRYIRRSIIYDIHSNLMDKEYGVLRPMGEFCPEVTNEAYEYLIANHSHERGTPVLWF